MSIREAIYGSHRLAVEASVIQAASGDEVPLDITAGSVTLDSQASIRGSLDLTLASFDAITPYGDEIIVSRGVEGQALSQLGVFRINDIEIDDSGDDFQVRVACQDRAAAVSDAKFEEPYQVANGTLFTTAIQSIVEDAIGPVETNFATTSVTTPGLVAEEGDDRWEFAVGLATALGAELYFDGTGVLVLQPTPVPADVDNHIHIHEGEGGILLRANRKWSRSGVFNRWIVTGENTDVNPPIRGVATDDDPSSPTYYYGPFGKAPMFWSNEYITTPEQAQDAAEGLKNAQLGREQAIDFDSVVDPTLRPGDIIHVMRERVGVGQAGEVHVLDAITIPLDAESSASGSTRVVSVG